MATTQSTEVTDIKVNTSLFIKESNDSSSNATDDTPSSGLFISPSSNVPGRPTNITGFIVTASNELGKLEFSDSVGFISLNDLSDVTITNVQDEDFLKYDAGTQQWINVSLSLTFVTVDGVQTLTNKTMTDNSNNLTARGLFSDSGSNTVSVFASPNPTSGQVLTATNATTATWQDPAGDVTLNGVQSLTNKTITNNTNNVTARGLFTGSGTGTVSTFAATAPSAGQVITATSATTATWQTPAGGDVTLNGVQTLTNKTMTSSTNDLTARGIFSDSGSNTVSVFASPNPTSGQIITATGASTATWQTPQVTLTGTEAFSNKTMTSSTNNVTSRGMFTGSGTGTVSTFAATAPSLGQVLTATGASTATWQDTGDVTLNGVQTLTNKTITDNTNNVNSRALFVNSGAGTVSTYAAAVPSSGQVLTATGATTATWQNTGDVTLNGVQTLTNKTITDNTNDVTARGLFTGSGTGTVSTFAATAPSAGQVITATSATTATWQTPASGDVTLNGVQTLTNKTITDNTNDVTSRGMFTGSGTGTVSTFAATAPSSGQVLTATGATTATWQDTGDVTLNGVQTLTNKTMTSSTNNVTSRGLFTDTGSGTVSTFAAAAPSSGQILTATGATTAIWQSPQVTLTGSETLTNKTMTSSTNNVTSRGLFTGSGTGTVSTFAAAAPSSGQVLTATGATTATWQTPSAAAGGSDTEVQFNNSGSLDGISGITTNGSTQLNFADNSLAQFGTGNDLTITHNASNSVITSNFGDLIIDNSSSNGSTINRLGNTTSAADFQIQDSTSDTIFIVDGAGSTQIEGVNNTSKFRVEDVANRTMFNVDSVNEETTAVSFIAQSIIFDRVIYVDEKAQNTNSGTFTSGAWQTRELNTTRYSRQTTAFSSLSSNQIELEPGTYYIYGSAPAYQVNAHQTRWRNVSDLTVEFIGTTEMSSSADGAIQSRSFIKGVITIASAKTFEFQHRCQTSKATNGSGRAGNLTTEVYAEIEIVRLA